MTYDVPFRLRCDIDLGPRVAPYVAVGPDGSGTDQPGDYPADVDIAEGAVPETITAVRGSGTAFMASERQFLLSVPKGPRYLVEDGTRIRYERRGANDQDVVLFLLSTAWAALCAQRGLLPLHSSAVLIGDAVHAFTGHSGMGKSTLAATLAGRGHMFFTDDILIVAPPMAGRPLRSFAGQANVKLWSDSIALTQSERGAPVRAENLVKKYYAAPHRGSDGCAGRFASLSLLATLDDRNAAEPAVIRPVQGAKARRALRNSVFRRPCVEAIWGRPRLYHMLAEIMPHIGVQTFERSLEKEHFSRTTDILETWLAQQEPTRGR